MPLRSVPLNPTLHDVDDFHSGAYELDGWLLDHAASSDASRITRTFVWTMPNSTSVIAYYSLMAHQLNREALPKNVGRGSPGQIPAILLARLAVISSEQGSGLGSALLGDAMERAARAGEQVGARFVIVDALHKEAATFYKHFGFRRIPDGMRLVQKLSSIVAAIAQA